MALSCGNFHHLQYIKDLYSKHSLYQIPDPHEAGQEMFACMKKCHGEICKVYNVKDDWKIAWNCDGKEGEDSTSLITSSIYVRYTLNPFGVAPCAFGGVEVQSSLLER